MKKLTLPGPLICVGLILFAGPAVESAAQEPLRHVPNDQILDFTLQRLQESLQNTLQQNKQIAFENTILRRNIQELLRKQDFLKSNEAGDASGAYPAYVLKGEKPGTLDMNARGRKTEELIVFFEQELQRLNEKIRIIDTKLDEKSLESAMNVLDQRKGIGEQNINRAQRKYKALVEANKAAMESIKRLKVENAGLTQALREMNTGY